MILLLLPAFAASLDLLEVGGLWGTPNATDATALWWNPASLAAGHGTRFNLSAAPTFATVNIQRADPGYTRDPSLVGPNDYDYSGLATFKRTAVVPGMRWMDRPTSRATVRVPPDGRRATWRVAGSPRTNSTAVSGSTHT